MDGFYACELGDDRDKAVEKQCKTGENRPGCRSWQETHHSGGSMKLLMWAPTGKSGYAALSFWILLALSILLSRYIPQAVTEATWYSITERILLCLPVAIWVFLDAGARLFEKHHRNIYAAMSLIVPEITVPVFLIQSRGWKEAGKAALMFLGYLLLVAVAVWFVQLFLDQLFPLAK